MDAERAARERRAALANVAAREPWFAARLEALEIALREWLDDDDAVSVVQKLVADGWLGEAALSAGQYVEARRRRDDAYDVGKWLGATSAPVDVIAAQERVVAALEDATLDLTIVRKVIERYGRVWAKDAEYYAAAEALGITEPPITRQTGICSCGGIDAVPGATDHASDCAIWDEVRG